MSDATAQAPFICVSHRNQKQEKEERKLCVGA